MHTFFLQCYAAILGSNTFNTSALRLLSLVFFDKNSEKKLQDAKDKLAQDPASDYYFEAAKVISEYTIQFLLTAIEEMRPFPWMKELIWEKPDGKMAYTILGQTLLTACTKHKILFSRYIELNLIQAFANFAKKIREIDDKRSFVLLDFVKDGLKEAREHLEFCQQEVRGQEKKEKDDFATREEQLASQVIEGAFNLFFPNGEKDLQLPVRDSLIVYVKRFIYPFAKDSLVPKLVAEAFEFVKHDFVKTRLVREAIEAIKTHVETAKAPPEKPEEVHTQEYPGKKKLQNRFKKSINCSVRYLIPDSLPRLLALSLPDLIAKVATQALIKGVPGRSLQDLVPLAVQRLLSALTEDGKWDDKGLQLKGRQVHFTHKQFCFPLPPAPKEHSDKLFKDKLSEEQRRLRELIDTTGDNLDGLVNIIQVALGTKRPKQSTSWWGSLSGFLSQKTVTLAGAPEIIKDLNNALADKMLLPVHDRLIVVLLDCAVNHFKD